MLSSLLIGQTEMNPSMQLKRGLGAKAGCTIQCPTFVSTDVLLSSLPPWKVIAHCILSGYPREIFRMIRSSPSRVATICTRVVGLVWDNGRVCGVNRHATLARPTCIPLSRKESLQPFEALRWSAVKARQHSQIVYEITHVRLQAEV